MLFANGSSSDIADISINEYLMISLSQKRKLAFELLTKIQSVKQTLKSQ